MALPSISAIATPIIYGAITGAVVYGSYKGIEALNARNNDYSPAQDYEDCLMQFDASSKKDKKKKSKDVYAPDRDLPKDKNGVPIPDSDAPHTQLGTKGSRRRPGEKYPQAREFDKNGKPIKTIDFSDHGEPNIHPNPHEHLYQPNPSGGTPQRGDPQTLENWPY